MRLEKCVPKQIDSVQIEPNQPYDLKNEFINKVSDPILWSSISS